MPGEGDRVPLDKQPLTDAGGGLQGGEVTRLAGESGKLMHASIRIGDSAVMLNDEFPDWGVLGPKALKGSAVTIHLYVDDVDAVVARAVGAGAKVTMPVADMFWGDRYGILEDPYGHKWSVATHVRDVTAAEMREAMKKMPKSPSH